MKRFIWIIMAACMLHACREHAGYTIRGELADADGMKVALKKMTIDSDDAVDMDSCIITKGKFEMKGTVKYPEYCELYAGDNGPLRLFVENTVINVAFDLKNIQDSNVAGSEETDLFGEYSGKMAGFEKSVAKVNDDYMSMKLSGETDAEKEKGYVAQMEQIRQQRIDYMKQFAKAHPNSMVTALIADNNLSYYVLPEELESYAVGFDTVNSKSPWVQSIREKAGAAKRLAVGQPFVDIRLPAPDGTEIALSDYAGKGKYVLVDFWASWCRPCRMANPHVVRMYHRYKDKGFEIVGVSLDKEKAEWTGAIEDDALVWPQMSDLKFWQSKGARLYSVNSIPYAVLLDRDGKILAKGLDPDELEKKLAELMEPTDK
ncbi:MAG: AhpC/TSA family protein [Bacteroidales bacterium]|jgi:peroxiredoxin|nr:AhpC/TSA family protein [Bacteroidales bacterium]